MVIGKHWHFLSKPVALVAIIVLVNSCATGNPPLVTRQWSVSPEGPQPIRDRKRDGYWWMPTGPPKDVDESTVWGNRGALYRAWERTAAEEPPVVAKAPTPEPPIVFAEIPEVTPVKIEQIVVRERIVLHNVLFDLDRAELRSECKPKIEKAATYLKEYRSDRIIVEGHTCALGTEEHNLALGMKRAEAVKRYLVALGVEPERIRTVSYGESQPTADNSTEETRQLNRRVVMEIVEVR